MSNIAGKAYAMNVLTPVKPWKTSVQLLIFMVTRALPQQLSGLLGLKLIHFARWVIIRRDQWPRVGGVGGQPELVNDHVLFLSNFNGTWDQYIDAFADGIPTGLDMLWYASTKYPHSIPISTFKDYITANQIDTNYYYNATPGSAQRDIKAALRVRTGLAQLAKDHATMAAGMDKPAAALIKDLKSRGMLEDTIVHWTTEFGRMPCSQGSKGRDHNPFAFTTFFAGGGFKGGVSYGASDEWSYKVAEKPAYCYDLHATMLHLLGVDHQRLTYRHNGIDRRITDVYGDVIREVIG